MSGRTGMARAALVAGLALGIAGDVLLRDTEPGLNLMLCAVLLSVALVVVRRRAGLAVPRGFALWLLAGVAFAGSTAWRASPELNTLAFGCAVLAFTLPVARAGVAWLRHGSAQQYVRAVVLSAGSALAGAKQAVGEADAAALVGGRGERVGWRRASGVARGAVLAVPLLIVFGGLFVAADAVFAAMVVDVLHIDVASLTSHAAVIALLAWIASGYLHGAVRRAHAGTEPSRPRRPLLGITDVAVAIGLLDLLFLAFVLVQFRYLFGGATLVEVTAGLTYAEYARRGFFELVAAVALVLPVLLAADALLRRERLADEYIFRVVAGVQILLVFAVTVSALQRMRLYVDAYGLTTQRFHATALLLLSAAILVWFAATVLRRQRRRFAFGALIAGFTMVAVLHVLNPEAVVLRTNLARADTAAASPRAGSSALDVSYATSLGADAVPVLLAALPRLSAEERCRVAHRLLRRWPGDAAARLRGWNWAESRARAEVGRRRASLLRMAGSDDTCGADPAPAGTDAAAQVTIPAHRLETLAAPDP